MTRHCLDLGSASDWSFRVGNFFQPIKSTTQISVVTRHQYGISALVSQTSFGGKTSGSVAKRRLFSQASISYRLQFFFSDQAIKNRLFAYTMKLDMFTKPNYMSPNEE